MSTHTPHEQQPVDPIDTHTDIPTEDMGVSSVVETTPGKPFLQTEGSVTGTITEALPDAKFRVDCKNTNGEVQGVIAYLSGRMRLHRIRVVVGDSVEVLLDGYSGVKGRITRRY